MRTFLRMALVAAGLAGASGAALASGPGVELMKPDFSFEGVFGQYDKAALKRGFQVYNDVCANCHSLRLVAYRNLAYLGFSEDEIKAIAEQKEVQDGPNDQGEMFMRPARAADRFVPPFANEQAARAANNGANPPDLSLITKARPGFYDYVYSLMLGYEDTPPEGHTVPDGMFYNKYFPGGNIAMPPPVMDDVVAYEDGTQATAKQIAHDVVTFLNWAAEPELDERKSLGLKVMIFLAVFTAMLYALKRQIWKDVH